MKKYILSIFIVYFLFLPVNVSATGVEIPNLIVNTDNYDSLYEEFIENDIEVITVENSNSYTYEDNTFYDSKEDIDEEVYNKLEEVLMYLDASVSIEDNSSTIIAGRKMICDEETGELEKVSCVYSKNLLVNKVITYALTKEGCQYSQAFREARDIFDCSSFVRRMYQEYTGVYLGSVCTDIAYTLRNYEVSFDEVEPGDLLFMPGHIALYIGNNQIIHAAGRKKGVIIADWMCCRWTNAYRPIDYIRDFKNDDSVNKCIVW